VRSRPTLLRRFRGDGAQEAEHPATPARRWADRLTTDTEGDDTEPVAASGGEASDDERGTLGHVGLAPVRRPEVHRRGVVEQEPGGQLPVGHVLADLRDQRARGGIPVDPADVVARLVRPDPVQLETGSVATAEVVAGHLATDAPVERELQLADQTVRDRARARSGRGAIAPADAPQVGGRAKPGGGRPSCGRLRRHLEARRRDERQDPLDDRVGGDPIGQRRVAQDEPVTEDVGGQGDDVGREGIAASRGGAPSPARRG